jgi:hypothetical protein
MEQEEWDSIKEDKATIEQMDSIESLLLTANLTPQHKEYIGYQEYTYEEAEKEIEYLKRNQRDVKDGFNLKAREINYILTRIEENDRL